MSDFLWINSAEQLDTLAQQWLQQDALAIDTEFMRTDTFYPKPALIQICDGKNTYLLDPLQVTELQPLADVLQAETVIKVFHACSEDLEVFQTLLGVVPQPLYDSQIAAALLGESFSLGYSALMKILLDVDVPKGETRSNWLKRPLTDSQCLYAAMDVSHLFEAYQILFARSEKLQRTEWILAEGERMMNNYFQAQQAENYYLKVKSAWKLSRRELAILQQLCEVREQRVRQINIPRSRWLKDAQLWDIAKRGPKSAKELANIQGIPASFANKNGDKLAAIVRQAAAINDTDLPAALPKPLSPHAMSASKKLRTVANSAAEANGLAIEVLLKKKDIEQLVRQQPTSVAALPEGLQGWRAEMIGEALIAELHKG
ncbi:Ribonuclease D [Sinobacterium norvegicum]|uniref:Ribonuclease D n=1 Tax=Sinobacterium norvegicum TaxID=1641715 RepID=A0ABN8EF89_9GAMM|nr:ribonuclease D [Sinobacterium norvegicum]CAH0989952.1 Ribonuclease D [Sinobacterium norvegicum]